MKYSKAFYLLKIVQLAIILLILWHVFSEHQICGHFVKNQDVLRHGIDGSCKRLFFYLPPQNAGPPSSNYSTEYLPYLRLWWTFDGHRFLPPQPGKQELQEIVQNLKLELAKSMAIPLGQQRYKREVRKDEEGRKKEMKKDEGKEEDEEEKEEQLAEFSLLKRVSIMPEEEQRPEEALELAQNVAKAEAEDADEKRRKENLKFVRVEARRRSNFVTRKRRRSNLDEDANANANELPWVKMQKSALLPHEESKKRLMEKVLPEIQTSDGQTEQATAGQIIEKRTKNDANGGGEPLPMEDKLSMMRGISPNSEDQELVEHCFEMNMQITRDPFENDDSDMPLVWVSPLVILANRSVATVAIGLAHLLLLFAQIYLLNCLEVDNLEQRRGKLFLELLIILLGLLGWLVIFVLKVRTEINWDPLWMCTNFQPEIFKMIIFVQVFASALVILGVAEGAYIFVKMRKCCKMIEIERENDMKPQRPSI